jgi:serine/threonine protein kinase
MPTLRLNFERLRPFFVRRAPARRSSIAPPRARSASRAPVMLTLGAGQMIGGRYRLLRKLGEGAMGVVWAARNESTDREFALKLMMPEATADGTRMARFFKEAKTVGRLRHRSIVEVYDLGRVDEPPFAGTPYLVMELLDGEPLDVVLSRLGRLPSGTALRLVGDVARALEVAHKQGIVHRDLKPGNLFLHRSLDGILVPKILDFGISKLMGRLDDEATDIDPTPPEEVTLVGTVLGSPAYMSPEQASGERDIDARSDVWSLGVILYRLVSGTLPFSGRGFAAIAKAIHFDAPPKLRALVPGLPDEVSALILRCLAKSRAERFQSARALADAIDELLAMHVLPTLELGRVVTMAAAAADRTPSERQRTAQARAAAPSSRPPMHSVDIDLRSDSIGALPQLTPSATIAARSANGATASLTGSSTRELPPTLDGPPTVDAPADPSSTFDPSSAPDALPVPPPASLRAQRPLWRARAGWIGAAAAIVCALAIWARPTSARAPRFGAAHEIGGVSAAELASARVASMPSPIASPTASPSAPPNTNVVASSAPAARSASATVALAARALPVAPSGRPPASIRPTTAIAPSPRAEAPRPSAIPAHEGITSAGF